MAKKKSAKKKAMELADAAWSRAVRAAWDDRCAICGKSPTEAHHLIGRRVWATRYAITNGIALCGRCHRLCPRISPHNGSVGFAQWLEDNHPSLTAWVRENKNNQLEPGTVKIAWYEDMIQQLEDATSDKW